MHLFPSLTIELIKLYYHASKNTIYVQTLVFKIKNAAKIIKLALMTFGATFTLLTLLKHTK